MTELHPQRLEYFKSLGWHMQTVSYLTNGLPGRKICGATNFSNPYDSVAYGEVPAADRVELFRDMLNDPDSRRGQWIKDNVHTLRGFNLFCTCRKGAPCSGDVLIELANAPACEGVEPLKRGVDSGAKTKVSEGAS